MRTAPARSRHWAPGWTRSCARGWRGEPPGAAARAGGRLAAAWDASARIRGATCQRAGMGAAPGFCWNGPAGAGPVQGRSTMLRSVHRLVPLATAGVFALSVLAGAGIARPAAAAGTPDLKAIVAV